MLNIVELEHRWLHYKIKSFLPHTIITLSVLTIVLVIVFFLSDNKSLSKTQKNVVIPKVIKTEIKVQKPIQKTQIATTIVVPSLVVSSPKTHSEVLLTPSLGFMKKMQNSIQPYYKNELSNAPTNYMPKVEVVQKSQRQVKVKQHVQVQEQIQEKPTVNKIKIKRQNTQNDIYEIIKRFKNNNNPALSLFIAKKYYELGNFEQAYNYALMTNEINENIESSWIVFAKSLVKLGKKEKAIKVLKSYINQSHSNSAKILLDNIYSGKFR